MSLSFLIGVHSQDSEEQDEIAHREVDIEQKVLDVSYNFFCEKIIDSDTSLAGVTILFSGKTTSAYSRVIYVADCRGDIDLVGNAFPNIEYLNRLQEYYDHLPPGFHEVSNLHKRTRKSVLFPGKHILVNLYIYRPIIYRGMYYILFYIMQQSVVKQFYGIRLDMDFKVVDYCTRHYEL